MNKNLLKYVNARGDFEFPSFLYHSINSLMKSTLDLGNLACSDPNQLRAFKETVKKNFKAQWVEIASILEEFNFISPCTCDDKEYCNICGGARFVTNDIMNSDVIESDTAVLTHNLDMATVEKLKEGLRRAKEEVEKLG